ncbi:MAG: hypothetical protein PHQ18_01065 [Patescibacteria group bacterium]|nr:hypothetical protein [Patescibacteria group bacterium]
MSKKIPTQNILQAFDISGKPDLLDGGQGTCFRVDNIVLKPTDNPIETTWLAEINNNLQSSEFRVPKYKKANNDSFVFEDWTASEFLEGEHKKDNYIKAIELSKIFHNELKDIKKPDWFDKKTDVFAIADKIAWGELPLPNFEPAKKQLENIFELLKENNLPNQLVHGDWGPGQILFSDTLPPAILDITPYFRPANYPIADMLISALANDNKDISIINLGKNIKEFDQLLLRALVFRTCTYIEFQIHLENDHDWTGEIKKYLDLFEVIKNR